MTETTLRRVPVGPEIVSGGCHFRVWAPEHKTVEVVLDGVDGRAYPLETERNGYFSAVIAEAADGTRYKYRLSGGESYPDPASRFQPEGPHGPSQVVDSTKFEWTDGGWSGLSPQGQVIYELHVGTFTREGTWRAAMAKLEWLCETGITVIEVMPINEFPGRFGWGYDGVGWYAPTRLYGNPDDFRAFIDSAHSLGIGVILDVVYNHFGPDGNYLGKFSPYYVSEKHQTDWGCALNFDGPNSTPVREFTVANASYWITEFHLDGLRLDATQNIYDDSAEHVLAEMARTARRAAGRRSVIFVAENEAQHTILVRQEQDGGYGLDMLWNDDFHHSAFVAMTGHNEAYYTDYEGKPQEFISAAKHGYLYQGQWYAWQDAARGTPGFGVPPWAFVNFTDNHDQVANSVSARRCVELTDSGTYKAILAFTLLSPGTPMLFQGQEFGATTPFYYFADHHPELAQLVFKGRRDFMLQFATTATPEMRDRMPDPADPEAFERCKLDWTEAERNQAMVRFHRDLLKLRREDATFNNPRPGGVDGAVLSGEAFLLRFFGENAGEDRLLIVNLGRDLLNRPAPEPLIAPPLPMQWDVMWSTEDPRFGGCGTTGIDALGSWRIPGHAAVVLRPGPETRPRSGGRPLEKIVRERNIKAIENRGEKP